METDKVREQDHRWNTSYHGADETLYSSQIEIMKRLFRLFPREDPDLLTGLDIAGIRKLCLEEGEQAESEKNMAGTRLNFVLVADKGILKNIANDIFVVKTVGYDWDPIQHRGVVGCDWDHRGSWGWMRLATGDLLELWEMILEADEISISKYFELGFSGSEEDLEKHIWLGAGSFLPLGDCSRVQTSGEHDKSGRFKFDP